jgi:hypothetical protein
MLRTSVADAEMPIREQGGAIMQRSARTSTWGIVAFALVVGSSGCEQREQPMRTGETRVTSGTVEPVPLGGASTDTARQLDEERAKAESATAEAASQRARADACEATREAKHATTTESATSAKTKAKAKAKPRAQTSAASKREVQGGMEPPAGIAPERSMDEPVGTTTITDAPVPASGDASAPAPASAPGEAAGSESNDSTTLGTGKSGTYTDGKGTYGGKATWGTGGGGSR